MGLSPRATEDTKGTAQLLTQIEHTSNMSSLLEIQVALMDNAPDWDTTISINISAHKIAAPT